MKKPTCDSCGSEMDHDEGYYHEDYKKDICSECYLQETDTCQLCGEDAMPSDVSEFIVVKCELGVTADRPPGIYRIMHRPFLSIPMIGSGSMDGNDVVFTDRLPKQDSEFEISGHICKGCARPYAKRFNEVYGSPARHEKNSRCMSSTWPPSLTFNGKRTGRDDRRGTYGWHLEKSHVQSTIQAHPEMLYDLECEPDHYDWQDFFKLFDLADERQDEEHPWNIKYVCRYKTWHDWLAMEHRGIKVYFTSDYQGMYGEGRWETMALRPEPKFRQAAWNRIKDPLLIETHSLPTIAKVKATYHLRHQQALQYKWWDGTWEERRLMACDLKAAIILAIEKGVHWNVPGAIRADGVIQKL